MPACLPQIPVNFMLYSMWEGGYVQMLHPALACDPAFSRIFPLVIYLYLRADRIPSSIFLACLNSHDVATSFLYLS